MAMLTDDEIVAACARAMRFKTIEWEDHAASGDNKGGRQDWRLMADGCEYNPLSFSEDCFSLENTCGVTIECKVGRAYYKYSRQIECFTPGNNQERRRAVCLVVAKAQLAKEQKEKPKFK